MIYAHARLWRKCGCGAHSEVGGAPQSRQSCVGIFANPAMSLGRQPQRVQSGPFSGKLRYPQHPAGAFPAKTKAPPPQPPPAAGATRATGGKFGRPGEYSEVRGDLFRCPPSASLAHCVSADLAMGKGIAKIFKRDFGGVKELREQGIGYNSYNYDWQRSGVEIVLCFRSENWWCRCIEEKWSVHILFGEPQTHQNNNQSTRELENNKRWSQVTKERHFHKPTYDTLQSSLVSLREECVGRGIGQLCMPRIGCGLDRLEWDRVRQMIMDTFSECGVSVTIYSLE